jgi:RNA polymerase sigma-70 factor
MYPHSVGADYFIGLLSPSIREEMTKVSNLEETLNEIILSCQEAWPTVALPKVLFLSFLAELLNHLGELPAKFFHWHLPDVYLLCGCLAGMTEAIAAFERQVFTKIEPQLQSILKTPDLISDLKQSLLQDLFVGKGEQPPKAKSYTGQTNLRNWLFVVAIRRAINLFHRAKKQRYLSTHDLSNLPILEEDPELQYLKVLYQHEFRAAFQHALATLSSSARNLLRYYFVEELTLWQIGELYQVNRVTVSRWFAKIRRHILITTRQYLIDKLQVDDAAYESIMRLLKSQLKASIKTYLAAEPESP